MLIHYICRPAKGVLSASKPGTFFFLLCISILAIFLFSARLGTVDISWQSFAEAILFQNPQNLAAELVWQVRIPRFLMALLAGGSLAVAGQAMQILVRNPLADPYTMGTASGASLGVNLAMSGFLPAVFSSVYLIPLWGFAGALAASFAVLMLVSRHPIVENSVLLLVGVAVSILANSMLSLLTFWAARQNEVRHLLFWSFGNLDKANWESLAVAAGLALPGLLYLWWGAPLWNLLLLGDDKAASLGVAVARSKRILLVVSALITASIVCMAGPIGFVGLVVPFWVRKMIPVTRSVFWPLNFGAGAVFLAFCDLAARFVYQPYGLPIGLITSLVGVPFFIWLLRSSAAKSSF